jgi:hypothetical protein
MQSRGVSFFFVTCATFLLHSTIPCSQHSSLLLVCAVLLPAAVPQSFGEELLAALLCQHPAAAAAAPAMSPTKGPSQAAGGSSSSSSIHQLQQQLTAGRAAMALSYLLAGNHTGQMQLLALQVPAGDGPPAAGAPAMSTPETTPALLSLLLVPLACHAADEPCKLRCLPPRQVVLAASAAVVVQVAAAVSS